MSLAVRSAAKEGSLAEIFMELPDVLIQDPVAGCAYRIPADQLSKFEAGPEAWSSLPVATVIFVIPGEDMLEEVPPFAQSEDAHPAVLIQYPKGDALFFLAPEDLDAFRIGQPGESDEGFEGISFVMPRGLELIEQLPAARRARLQSNTA